MRRGQERDRETLCGCCRDSQDWALGRAGPLSASGVPALGSLASASVAFVSLDLGPEPLHLAAQALEPSQSPALILLEAELLFTPSRQSPQARLEQQVRKHESVTAVKPWSHVPSTGAPLSAAGTPGCLTPADA